jgi:hypothetical protein
MALTKIGDAGMPAGAVLQVVSGQLSSGFSTSNSSYTDTGLSVSITPSNSNNKIVVYLAGHGGQDTSGRSCFYQALRGSTLVARADNLQTGTTGSVMPLVLIELDSPSTTSATTYKIQMRTDGSGTVSMSGSSTQNSSLILMEIAG